MIIKMKYSIEAMIEIKIVIKNLFMMKKLVKNVEK